MLIGTVAQVSMLFKSWLEHHHPNLMIKENHNLLDEPDQLRMRLNTSSFIQLVVDRTSQLYLSSTLFCTFLLPCVFLCSSEVVMLVMFSICLF